MGPKTRYTWSYNPYELQKEMGLPGVITLLIGAPFHPIHNCFFGPPFVGSEKIICSPVFLIPEKNTFKRTAKNPTPDAPCITMIFLGHMFDHIFKGKWRGTYSRPIEHLGSKLPPLPATTANPRP